MPQTLFSAAPHRSSGYQHRRRLATAILGTLAISLLQLSGSIAEPHSPAGQVLQEWGISEAALAKAPRYIPPKRRGMPKRTQGGGSRGCAGLPTAPADCAISLTALVPADHIGLTTAARPVLSWYASQRSEQPWQVTLVEPGVSKPLWVQQIPQVKAGLNQFQIPANAPELKPGRRYRWAVSQANSSDRSVSSPITRGWIERVELPNQQSQQMLAISSQRDRANWLAEAGLWYDALTEYTQALKANPQDPQPLESLFSLFQQGGLTQVIQWEQTTPTLSKPVS